MIESYDSDILDKVYTPILGTFAWDDFLSLGEVAIFSIACEEFRLSEARLFVACVMRGKLLETREMSSECVTNIGV